MLVVTRWISTPTNRSQPTFGRPDAGVTAGASGRLAQAGPAGWWPSVAWGSRGASEGVRGVGDVRRLASHILSRAMTRAVAGSDWLQQKGSRQSHVPGSPKLGRLCLGWFFGSAVVPSIFPSLSPLPHHSSRPNTRHSHGQSKSGTVSSLRQEEALPRSPQKACISLARAVIYVSQPRDALNLTHVGKSPTTSPLSPRHPPVRPVGQFTP